MALAAALATWSAPFDSALPSDLIAFQVEHNPADAIPVRRGERTLSAAELRAYIGHLLRVGKADAFGPGLPDVARLAGGHRIQAREHLLPQAAALVACLVDRAKGMRLRRPLAVLDACRWGRDRTRQAHHRYQHPPVRLAVRPASHPPNYAPTPAICRA